MKKEMTIRKTYKWSPLLLMLSLLLITVFSVLLPESTLAVTPKIAAGDDHTIALRSNGTLWAWGWNGYGQVGDGTTTDRHSPVQIGSDTNWVAIAAGDWHTIALKSNGTLWSWGSNGLGQLGDGTTTNKNRPVQIGSDPTWVAIAGGYYHTIALKSNGTLWAWGWNGYGQLGDGTNIDKNSPVPIQLITISQETILAQRERSCN